MLLSRKGSVLVECYARPTVPKVQIAIREQRDAKVEKFKDLCQEDLKEYLNSTEGVF